MHVIALVALLAADPVPVEDLTAREGEVEVVGRYQEFLDLHLKLCGSPLTFALASQDSAKMLFGLRAGIDRLIVRGRFADKDTIAVASMEKTETEAQVYARRGEELQGPSAALLDLGARAAARAAAFGDTELGDAGRAILRKGFLARKQETPAGDAAALLAWVNDMVARLGDTKWAIEEVSAALARDPSWEPGADFLRSLGCIQWRDAWYPRDEFLALQGLVGADGDWRLPEESAVKEHVRPELPEEKLPPDEARDQSENGVKTLTRQRLQQVNGLLDDQVEQAFQLQRAGHGFRSVLQRGELGDRGDKVGGAAGDLGLQLATARFHILQTQSDAPGDSASQRRSQ